MKNCIIYLTVLLGLFANKLLAQETIESKVKLTGEKIEEIDVQFEKRAIRKEQVDERKKKLAEARAIIIENKGANIQIANKLLAQETFESKVKWIGEKIENIVKEEKAALKTEIEEVNVQFEKGAVSQEKADERKKKLAEERAIIIENKVAIVQNELKELVQQKVDGKIIDGYNPSSIAVVYSKARGKKTTKKIESEKRTTSQFVFATGINNLVTSSKYANSDFKYLDSHFYELGATFNFRLLNETNLLHLKYGVSVMYNNLRPTQNRIFVIDGDKTNLVNSTLPLSYSRFKNVYLVAPLHLEFDFTKKLVRSDESYFRSHKSYRIGLGGYIGARVKTKQFQEYSVEDQKYTIKQKGDFNANDFIYGVSSYIGYKQTSLYFKYDLNPVFEDNNVKQNNVSLGVRFDFN